MWTVGAIPGAAMLKGRLVLGHKYISPRYHHLLCSCWQVMLNYLVHITVVPFFFLEVDISWVFGVLDAGCFNACQNQVIKLLCAEKSVWKVCQTISSREYIVEYYSQIINMLRR